MLRKGLRAIGNDKGMKKLDLKIKRRHKTKATEAAIVFILCDEVFVQNLYNKLVSQN